MNGFAGSVSSIAVLSKGVEMVRWPTAAEYVPIASDKRLCYILHHVGDG